MPRKGSSRGADSGAAEEIAVDVDGTAGGDSDEHPLTAHTRKAAVPKPFEILVNMLLVRAVTRIFQSGNIGGGQRRTRHKVGVDDAVMGRVHLAGNFNHRAVGNLIADELARGAWLILLDFG